MFVGVRCIGDSSSAGRSEVLSFKLTDPRTNSSDSVLLYCIIDSHDMI